MTALRIIGSHAHKYEIEGFPRHVGPDPGHLSECFLTTAADLKWNVDPDDVRCTCDDWHPE